VTHVLAKLSSLKGSISDKLFETRAVFRESLVAILLESWCFFSANLLADTSNLFLRELGATSICDELGCSCYAVNTKIASVRRGSLNLSLLFSLNLAW
jgi:hypothetical protein